MDFISMAGLKNDIFSVGGEIFDRFLAKLFWLTVIIVATVVFAWVAKWFTYFVILYIEGATTAYYDKLPSKIRNRVYLWTSLVKVTIFVVGILVAFSTIDLGIGGVFVAVLTLVIGLAFQPIILNAASAFIIRSSEIFDQSDTIRVDTRSQSVEGDVIKITWQNVYIQKPDGSVVELQNSTFRDAWVTLSGPEIEAIHDSIGRDSDPNGRTRRNGGNGDSASRRTMQETSDETYLLSGLVAGRQLQRGGGGALAGAGQGFSVQGPRSSSNALSLKLS